MNSYSFKLSTYAPDSTVDPRGKNVGGAFIAPWGKRNDFPSTYSSLVDGSTSAKACINLLENRAKGDGFVIPEGTLGPNPLDSWDDILTKALSDFILFQGFAFRVCLTKDGSTVYFYPQDFQEIRLGRDGTDDEGFAFTSYDWTKVGTYPVQKYPIYDGTLAIGETKMLIFRNLKRGERYYHQPQSGSAGKWMATESSIATYYENFVNNNFSATKLVTVPYALSDEKEEELYDNLKASFSGAENAASFVLLTGDGNGALPTISTISSADASLYDQVIDIVSRKICAAFGVQSPSLAGIPQASGFSSQAEELIVANKSLELNTIKPLRDAFLERVNRILHIHRNSEVDIKPINLSKFYEDGTISDQGSDLNSDDMGRINGGQEFDE